MSETRLLRRWANGTEHGSGNAHIGEDCLQDSLVPVYFLDCAPQLEVGCLVVSNVPS